MMLAINQFSSEIMKVLLVALVGWLGWVLFEPAPSSAGLAGTRVIVTGASKGIG
jgi:hypothetical protein